MKRMAGVFAWVMIGLIVFSTPAFAAEAGRIGVVDFQQVLVESEAGKAMQAKIQQRGRAMEADLMKMGEEIEAMMRQLQRDSMVMSAERREQSQRELEIRRYDFQTMQKKYQAEFREMEVTILEQLRDEVLEIAESIGKREGYMLIIERGAVIYFPAALDMTDTVIREYNEQFEGEL